VPVVEVVEQPLHLQPLHLHLHLPTVLQIGLVINIVMIKTTMLLANLMEVTVVTILSLAGTTTVQ
jgi:hypothetical protein